jgi:hypothetical protein
MLSIDPENLVRLDDNDELLLCIVAYVVYLGA